jgi:hypothetical protein
MPGMICFKLYTVVCCDGQLVCIHFGEISFQNIVLQNDVHFIFLSDSDTFKYMQCHQYMQNDYSAQILVVFWINRAKNNKNEMYIILQHNISNKPHTKLKYNEQK